MTPVQPHKKTLGQPCICIVRPANWGKAEGVEGEEGTHTDRGSLMLCVWEFINDRAAPVVVVQVEKPERKLMGWQRLKTCQSWQMFFAPAAAKGLF